MGYHGLGHISTALAGRGGWAGVDAFFVISGFLITSLLLQELRDTGAINIKLFMMRRILRIGRLTTSSLSLCFCSIQPIVLTKLLLLR